LLIAFFSWLLFKVALSRADLITLIVSFFGVVILIHGTVGDNSSQNDTPEFTKADLIIPSILLVLIPFNGAAINLFLR